MGMRTGYEGVAAFDLVNKAMGEKKIKGAVNRDRGGARAMFGHALDNVIGANGGVALGHRSQDIAPLAGQFAATPLAGALGPGDQIIRAMTMVVVGVKESHIVII